MTELEKLTKEIMTECEKEGEPITEQEALEMAQMELKDKSNRRYEKSDKPRKKSVKARKVDETKKHLLDCCKVLLEGLGVNITALKTETEISFILDEELYTLKLIKHRPKK